jgi:hypothetical protein
VLYSLLLPLSLESLPDRVVVKPGVLEKLAPPGVVPGPLDPEVDGAPHRPRGIPADVVAEQVHHGAAAFRLGELGRAEEIERVPAELGGDLEPRHVPGAGQDDTGEVGQGPARESTAERGRRSADPSMIKTGTPNERQASISSASCQVRWSSPQMAEKQSRLMPNHGVAICSAWRVIGGNGRAFGLALLAGWGHARRIRAVSSPR